MDQSIALAFGQHCQSDQHAVQAEHTGERLYQHHANEDFGLLRKC
jgi:hypothetical protein